MLHFFLSLLAAILISACIPWVVRHYRRHQLRERFQDGYLSGIAGMQAEDALAVPVGLLLIDRADAAAAFVVGYSAAIHGNLDQRDALRLFRAVWREQSCNRMGLKLTRYLLQIREQENLSNKALHMDLRAQMLDEGRELLGQLDFASPRRSRAPA